MSEMVERVVFALKQVDWSPEFPGYEAFARAAIEAMREPTPAMMIVMLARLGCGEDHAGIYRAMIDAALAEGTEAATTPS